MCGKQRLTFLCVQKADNNKLWLCAESRTSTSLSKSPVKKAGPKGPASQRKPKGRGSSEPVVEERKCPLEQCDSSGHLSGKLPTHFTLEACPMYHNKTPQQCKVSAHEQVLHVM